MGTHTFPRVHSTLMLLHVHQHTQVAGLTLWAFKAMYSYETNTAREFWQYTMCLNHCIYAFKESLTQF